MIGKKKVQSLEGANEKKKANSFLMESNAIQY